MNKTLIIAAVLMTGACWSAAAQPSSPVLQSLPAEVQKQIEARRASCREHFVTNGEEPNQSWMSSTANGVASVSSGDAALETFTVSGLEAIIINELELCGGQCLRGVNCSNHGGYFVTIYVRRGATWKEALSANPFGSVFLSIDWQNDKRFKALVLSVFGGGLACPIRDKNNSAAWKQERCDIVIKWNGTKFTYKPL